MAKKGWRKRDSLRVLYGKHVIVHMENGSVLAGRAVDISSSGFYLECTPGEPLENFLGRKGHMEVDLQVEVLRIQCEVKRVQKVMDKEGVGFHFIQDA